MMELVFARKRVICSCISEGLLIVFRVEDVLLAASVLLDASEKIVRRASESTHLHAG